MLNVVKKVFPLDESIDVLLEIISHLDVASLVMLSMTSTSLRQIIHETRFIWIRALRQIEQSEFLAPHSLALHNMGLSELIRCATRPLRMKHQFQPGYNTNLATYKFRLDYPIPKEGRPSKRHSRVLPGGRWLLTTRGADDSTYLFCWDLKRVSEAEKRMVLSPVAQIKSCFVRRHTPHHVLEDYVNVEFDPSHRRVNILLFYEGGNNQMVYEMFHLSWSTEDAPPMFLRLSNMAVSSHLLLDNARELTVSLVGDIVCVCSSGGLTLWNWRTETWANVTMGNDIRHVAWWIQPPFIFTISLLSAGSISVLRIPPLGPVGEPLVSHPGILELLQFEIPTDLINLNYRPFSDWRPHTVQPHLRLFDLVRVENPSEQLLVDTENHFDTAESPRVLQSSHWSSPNAAARPYLLSNNFIASIFPWATPSSALSFRVLLFRPRNPTLQEPLDTSVRFSLNGKGWKSGMLLPAPCAVSGRFVVCKGGDHAQALEDKDASIYALGCFL